MIVFLDFDGVICTGRVAYAYGDRGVIATLDPVALRFLDRMCSMHEISIVVSSGWRFSMNKRNAKAIFAAAGATSLANSLHKYWSTPVLPNGTRGDEIQEWLDRHGNGGNIPFVIIDDDDDLHVGHKPRFIKTDCSQGMLLEHFELFEEFIHGRQ